MTRIFACAALALALAPRVTFAQHAVNTLQNYACANLAQSEAQLLDRNAPGVPVLTEPRAGAPVAGIATPTVIVGDPQVHVGEFTEVLLLSGQPGWVSSRLLKPYASASNPKATCQPAVMGNGRLGFHYGRG